ncbi:MAG TPA: hypothetical protein VF132_03975, partial [Rudaea sp.]
MRSRRLAALILCAIGATLLAPILIGGRNAYEQALQLPMRSYAILLAVIVASWIARALKLRLLFER